MPRATICKISYSKVSFYPIEEHFSNDIFVLTQLSNLRATNEYFQQNLNFTRNWQNEYLGIDTRKKQGESVVAFGG